MGINSLAIPLRAIKTKYKQKHTNTLDVFFFHTQSDLLPLDAINGKFGTHCSHFITQSGTIIYSANNFEVVLSSISRLWGTWCALLKKQWVASNQISILICINSIIMIFLKILGDNGVKIMFEALSCCDDWFIFHEHYKKSKLGYDSVKRRYFYTRAYWLAWAGRRSIIISTRNMSVMTFN